MKKKSQEQFLKDVEHRSDEYDYSKAVYNQKPIV